MKVVFWGTPEFAVPTLLALGEEGHDVTAVVTRPDRPAGRGRRSRPSAVKEVADREALPVLQPDRVRGDAEFADRLRELQPDVSLVVAFGEILPEEVLEIPAHGSLNLHASLLPELRGAAPIQWSILRGHERSGVSVMRMDAGLDTGPILYQVAEPIGPDETASELRHRLAEIGAEAVVDALAEMEHGTARATPQEEARATYAPKIERADARIDWTRSAEEVGRWTRGMDDMPGAWSTMKGGDTVKLYRGMAVETDLEGTPGTVLQADPRDGLLVATGQGAVRIEEVQPPGKRRMSASEWVRGRGVEQGARFT